MADVEFTKALSITCISINTIYMTCSGLFRKMLGVHYVSISAARLVDLFVSKRVALKSDPRVRLSEKNMNKFCLRLVDKLLNVLNCRSGL